MLVHNVVHGLTGDDIFFVLPQNDAFFPRMRGNSFFFGKAEKGCFPDFFGFRVRKYASLIFSVLCIIYTSVYSIRPKKRTANGIHISVAYRDENRFRSDKGKKTRLPINSPIFIRSDRIAK